MKRYTVYLGILAIGVLLGWLLFGNSSNKETSSHQNEVAETNQMWTCSMHPQIMQPEPGDCPICGMELIPAENGSDGLMADQFKLTENAMALANVQTSIVGSGTADKNTIKLSGKIVINETSNTVQVSYHSGRIERLHVSFTGENIRKGQLLATIYSPELYAAQQELITAYALKESQPGLYKAVKNKLKLWKLSEKQINQIENSGKVLENFPVYATVSGTISQKLVEQGDYIKQGQPLLKLAKLQNVWANFDIYENQIDLFKEGQNVVIATNAYPEKNFQGKVSFIDPVLDTQTRTVKLRVVLNNKDHALKPGMFVEGKIDGISSKKEQALSIPSTAVLWTGERSVVYVKVQPDKPVFELREVKLGNATGDNYAVLSGLEKGDEIVTNGTFTIDAAAQLQGKKSMMNQEGNKTVTGHEGHNGLETKSNITKTDPSEMNERIKVSEKFQEQLNIVVENYMHVKNALADDDPKKAKEAAKTVGISMHQIDMKLLPDGEAHKHWMKLEAPIKTSADAIANEQEIEKQRDHFKQLSENLISAVQLFGTNRKIYSQFCPMADNNNGAYWLSNEKKITNPYFGEAMHACGNVANVIE